jgi:hypothetical protein
MRMFGRKSPTSAAARQVRPKKRILSRKTLDAFLEIRDVLRDREK